MAESLKLAKPIDVNGEKVAELPYDFDAMTAADKLAVSREMAANGYALATSEEFDPVYHSFLFAKSVEAASGGKITVQDVLRISAKDMKKGGVFARSFFYLSE